MKIIYVLIIALICFSCNSEQTQENDLVKKNHSTLIPVDEYLYFAEDCSHKILSSKLIEQMSAKMYLFRNDLLTEEEVIQKVIFYLESEPSTDQKSELEKYSAKIDWSSWSPPSSNHPLGFVHAEVQIPEFEKYLCSELIKKVDSGEIELHPDILMKLNELNK